jgi:Uma2 family endonuclease
LQTAIAAFYYIHRKQGRVHASTEQRVQVAPARFRIPDVCVSAAAVPEQTFHTPPLICIEILSKDDRLSEMRERVEDYLNFGVPYVWILDPTSARPGAVPVTGCRRPRNSTPKTPIPPFRSPNSSTDAAPGGLTVRRRLNNLLHKG